MQTEREYCRAAERERLGGAGGYTGDEECEGPEPLQLSTMSRKDRWRAYIDYCNEAGRLAMPFGEWIVREW